MDTASRHFVLVDLLHHNGDLVVLITHSSHVMIHKEGHFLLRICSTRLHHMVIILHNKHQEAASVQVGSKDHQWQCRRPHLRQITTTGSHRVQIMGSQLLILKHLLNNMVSDIVK